MPDKCWCGKELVKVVERGDPQEPTESHLECPTHGEDWRWRECDRRRLRTRKGGWRTRDPHHRQCDIVGIVPAWVCRGCEIPDLDRKAKLWDASGEKLVEAVGLGATCRCAYMDARTTPPETCIEAQEAAKAALAAHSAAEKEASNAR